MIRPHRFEFSDSVSQALRFPAASEADKEEDRLQVGVANVIDAHSGE